MFQRECEAGPVSHFLALLALFLTSSTVICRSLRLYHPHYLAPAPAAWFSLTVIDTELLLVGTGLSIWAHEVTEGGTSAVQGSPQDFRNHRDDTLTFRASKTVGRLQWMDLCLPENL